MEIHRIVRDADDYERNYGGLTELTSGYYTPGHVPKVEFVGAVLEQDPRVMVDVNHFGWLGRFIIDGHTNDRGGKYQPHRPSEHDVVHTYWRGKDVLRRARPGTRGAYPVTYLPVEAIGGALWDFSDVWQEGEWVTFMGGQG